MLFCLTTLPASYLAFRLARSLVEGPLSGARKALLLLGCCLLTPLLTVIMQQSVFRATSLADPAVTPHFLAACLGCSGIAALMSPLAIAWFCGGTRTRDDLKGLLRRFREDLARYAPYAVQSAESELKSQVVNLYLSWMWWLIEPVCMMLIYAFVFDFILRAGEPYFPLFLFVGITFWGFFARNARAGVTVIRASKGIITKIYLPKYILYLSKMFVNSYKILFSLAVIVLMMLIWRPPLSINLLFLPLILAILFLFTFASGVILMHWGVFINDLDYVMSIVLLMMMYVAGVFYNVAARAPHPFGLLIEAFMPLTNLIAAIRKSLLYCATPDWKMLVVWLLASLCLTVFGIRLVYKNENTYVKVI